MSDSHDRPVRTLAARTLGATVRASARRDANGRRRGFTIVELMLVVALIGLIASIVTVSWRAVLPYEELNAEVRRLSNLIQTARSEAISRSSEYQVVYDLGTREYWLLPPFGEDGSFEPEPEKRTPLLRRQLPLEISFESVTIDDERFESNEQVFVRFDAVGSSNAHTVVLKQSGEVERWFTIEILALTGQIRFHEGVFEREEVEDADFE
jgi:prepilin-type N-terminal cleavage/methylation domain-containing protein